MNRALITNVVMAGVRSWDRPDYADAYVESADYDGKPMTEAQLEELNADGDFVNEQAHESTH